MINVVLYEDMGEGSVFYHLPENKSKDYIREYSLGAYSSYVINCIYYSKELLVNRYGDENI